MSRRSGYTLIELIVTVILIAVISGLAINNFLKAMQQGYEQDAIMTLRLIENALEVQWRTKKDFPNANSYSRAAINNALGLQLPEKNFINSYQYTYFPNGTDDPYYILDIGTASGWSVSYDYSTDQHYCSAGSCPTCDATGCPSANF